MKFKIAVVLFCGLFSLTGTIHAQNIGVKTNLLYWATTTPNLAFEFGLGKKTTLDIVGTYNNFQFKDNSKLKNWSVQPEFRLWNCERFNRGFWGLHLTFGEYNAGNIDLPMGIFKGLKDYRYDGWMAGGGISYGYQWYLGPHWNLEATFGFGYLYLDYDRYECRACGKRLDKGTHHYFGPTKIGVSFIYLFKSKK